jgi:predicted  nucleic acid-binding Zn-ribbon protein
MSDLENEKFQDLVLNHLAKLTQEITELKGGQQKIESDIVEFKQEVNERFDKIEHIMVTKDDLNHALAEGQKDIFSMLQHIDKKMDKGFTDVVEVQKALTEMYGDHEAAIRILRRRPV